jgi:hypothetical protein
MFEVLQPTQKSSGMAAVPTVLKTAIMNLVMNELLATFRVRFSQPVSILGHSSITSWSYLTSQKQFDYVYKRNSHSKIIFLYA